MDKREGETERKRQGVRIRQEKEREQLEISREIVRDEKRQATDTPALRLAAATAAAAAEDEVSNEGRRQGEKIKCRTSLIIDKHRPLVLVLVFKCRNPPFLSLPLEQQ